MDSLICVSGPRGAGKETVLNAVLNQNQGLLQRVVPFTTREKRAAETHGREYYFIPKKFFNRMTEDRLLYSVQIGSGENSYFSGTIKDEFERIHHGITDITVEGAKILSNFSKRSLLIYVYASFEERLERVIKRQDFTEEQALALLSNEPSPANNLEEAKTLYPEFVILENHDGVGVEQLLRPVSKIIKASVF